MCRVGGTGFIPPQQSTNSSRTGGYVSFLDMEPLRYPQLRQSIGSQITRLHDIYSHRDEGTRKNRHIHAGEKFLTLSQRMTEVGQLLRDRSFFSELKHGLPRRLVNDLTREFPNQEDQDDMIKSAFTLAYVRRDLRATRGWFRNFNVLTDTSGSTTSYNKVLEKAQELDVDLDLARHFRKVIENPVKHWRIPNANTRSDLLTVRPRLVFDDQRGQVGHAGAQFVVEHPRGQNDYIKVEGTSERAQHHSGNNHRNPNFSVMVFGKSRTVDFPPVKVTPSQFKLMQNNLKSLSHQRYSLLKFNCAHVARRALRFAGIDLPSRLKPKNLMQSALKRSLQWIKTRSQHLERHLSRGIKQKSLSVPEVNELVVERLGYEIERLKQEITQQKVSRFTIGVQRKEQKVALLEGLLRGYREGIEQDLEPFDSFKQAFAHAVHDVPAKTLRNKIFEGRTKKCIMDLYRPLRKHHRQMIPIKNHNRQLADVYATVGEKGEDFVGLGFGIVGTESGFKLRMKDVHEENMNILRAKVHRAIANSNHTMSREEAMDVIKSKVRGLFAFDMLASAISELREGRPLDLPLQAYDAFNELQQELTRQMETGGLGKNDLKTLCSNMADGFLRNL